MNLNNMSIRSIASAIAKKEVSSSDVTRHYVDNILTLNPKLNAIIQTQDLDELFRQAEQADLRIHNKDSRGLLTGVPITVKDACHVKGFRMSRGLPELAHDISAQDATAVSRLRREGTLVLGITNVPEFCMSFETNNRLYGRTFHKSSDQYSPGGSSGGEAVAISAGMSPAGLGSDACGSLRLPAHLNGIVSLKLTQGRVPLTGQFPADRSGLFHLTSSFGPMGRFVDDVEIMAKIISGQDPMDPDSVDVVFSDNKSLRDLRIAFADHKCIAPVSSETSALLADLKEFLIPDVSQLETRNPEFLEDAYEALLNVFILGGDSGKNWFSLFSNMNINSLTPEISGLIDISKEKTLSVSEFRHHIVMRDTFRYSLATFYQDVDIYILPVFPDTAFHHGESLNNMENYRYLFPFSLSGSPVLTLSLGTDHKGLPIAVQIVAPLWKEERLFLLGKHIERNFKSSSE